MRWLTLCMYYVKDITYHTIPIFSMVKNSKCSGFCNEYKIIEWLKNNREALYGVTEQSISCLLYTSDAADE